MRTLVKCLLLVLLSPLAAAQGFRRQNFVLDSNGHPIPSVLVRVCNEPAVGVPCTPLASIFTDKGLTQVLQNPFNGDQVGNYFYYAANGNYHDQLSGPGIVTSDYPDIILGAQSPCLNTVSLAFASSLTFDGSQGCLFKVTLAGNVTSSSFINGTIGSTYTFVICQDGTGGRTIVWPGNFINTSQVAPVASYCSVSQYTFDGTSLYSSPSPAVYNIAGTIPSKPASAQIIVNIKLDRAISFAANMAGSTGTASIAATAQTVFSIQKNSVQFATMTFAAAGTTGVFAGAATNLATGDLLTIIAPAQDATLANIGFVLTATR